MNNRSKFIIAVHRLSGLLNREILSNSQTRFMPKFLVD